MRKPRSTGFKATATQVSQDLVLETDELLCGLDVDEHGAEIVVTDDKGLEIGTDRFLVLWNGVGEHIRDPRIRKGDCRKSYVG